LIEILFLKQVIALIGTALASYTDIKTGLIYDEITYPMIAFGLLFNLVEFNLNAFLLAAVVFVIGYLLYFGGKIGGGDVKLFLGLALLVPFVGGQIFILNVIVISGIVSILFLSVYYLIKYAKAGISIEDNKQGIVKAIILLFVFFVYFYFGLSNNLFSINFIIFIGIPIFFALTFVAFEHGIKKNFFLKKIELKNLEEDDLIATEFLDEEIRKNLSLKFKGIIDKNVERKLIQLKVKNILVYRGLPKFAPFVLIGVIISVFFPDSLYWAFL